MKSDSHDEHPVTCPSSSDHKDNVIDDFTHYSGCLGDAAREEFFKSLSVKRQKWIRKEEERISTLRDCLDRDEDGGNEISTRLSASLQAWRQQKRGVMQPPEIAKAASRAASRRDEFGLYADVVCFKTQQPDRDPKPHNNDLCLGEFPNQKVPLEDLLYNHDKNTNPLMKRYDDREIRYFHLPANNVEWIEKAIARHYHEKTPVPDENLSIENSTSKTYNVLQHGLWLNPSQRVSGKGMPPRCETISHDAAASPNAQSDLVLFMPYLNWETQRRNKRFQRLTKHIEQKRSTHGNGDDNKMDGLPSSEQSGTFSRGLTTTLLHPNKFRNPLGYLLYYAAVMSEVMDCYPEERVMLSALNRGSVMHPRRTLHQSYYNAMNSNEEHDRDQIINRSTQSGRESNICDCKPLEGKSNCGHARANAQMIDQLWMWILDGNTIITSFPEQFGKTSSDLSSVQRRIVSRGNATGTKIQSIYDLALIVITECSMAFVEKDEAQYRIDDRKPSVRSILATSLTKLTIQQNIAYETFWAQSSLLNNELKSMNGNRYHQKISEEFQFHTILDKVFPLMRDTQHVTDELQLMMGVVTQQKTTVRDFQRQVKLRRITEPINPKGRMREVAAKGLARSSSKPASFASRLRNDLTKTYDNLDNLIFTAKSIKDATNDLADLIQQQAGVIEAREAVKQAEQSLRQGRSIIVFTVSTIVILPINFLASFYSMNLAFDDFKELEWRMPSDYYYGLFIGTTFVVMIISFLMAFSGVVRARLWLAICLGWSRYTRLVSRITSKSMPSASGRNIYKSNDGIQIEGGVLSDRHGGSSDKKGHRSEPSNYTGIRGQALLLQQKSNPHSPDPDARELLAGLGALERKNPIGRGKFKAKETSSIRANATPALLTPILRFIRYTVTLVLAKMERLWILARQLFQPLLIPRARYISDLIGTKPLLAGEYRLNLTCNCGNETVDIFKDTSYSNIHGLATELKDFGYVTRATIDTKSTSFGSNILRSISESLRPFLRFFRAPHKLSFLPTSITRIPSNSLQPHQQTGKCRFLHVCIEKGHYSTRLHHMDLCEKKTDRAVFDSLRREYKNLRSEINGWFFKVRRINFVKFQLYPKSLVDSIIPNQLPPPPPENNDYEYHPAPPESNPPVGPNFMMHLWHCKNEVPEKDFFCKRFPKKKERPCKFEWSDESGANMGWGLHIVESLNMNLIVWVILAFTTVSGMVFAVCWTLLKSDISGAYTVASYITGLFSLVLMGIMSIYAGI